MKVECEFTKKELESEGFAVISQVPLMSINQYVEVRHVPDPENPWTVFWVKRSDLERMRTRLVMQG